MHMTFRTLMTATLTISLMGAANALSFSEIERLDTNGNEKIDKGWELDALNRMRNQFSGFQIVVYEEWISKPGFTGIPIDKLDDRAYYEKLLSACSVDKRFFLQDSVSDINLLIAGILKPTKNGASVSISQNKLTDVTSWNVNGAAAWITPFSKRCFRPSDEEISQGTVLTGFAFAPYMEFNGKGASNNKSVSNLTFGVSTQMQLFGGVFNLQEISFNPYYRTDFQGDASIPGMQFSWKPYLYSAHLNAYPNNQGSYRWWWSFAAQADYWSVQNAGQSGQMAGSESGWIGFTTGAQIETTPASGIAVFANINYQSFYDLINSRSAQLLSVGTGLHLSEDRRTSLVLQYNYGRNYTNFVKVDGVSLDLKFAY